MNCPEKVGELNRRIEEVLLPLIDNDYVLWECPYYSNIGDVLIWEGELQFLKKTKYTCLDMASSSTCRFPKLSPEVIILLQGGGNFGDLWRTAQNFRLKVCQAYPDNKIILFPQTIFYMNPEQMKADARILSAHPRLTICVRDKESYRLACDHFGNTVLLVPDMAFCISSHTLEVFSLPEEEKALFLKRTDKEGYPVSFHFSEKMPLDVSDWPTIEKKNWQQRLLNGLLKLDRYVPVGKYVADRWAFCFFRKHLIQTGIRFVSRYKVIYTTRLHILILSVLLDKKCFVIDNTYGKNSSFYTTWLVNCQGIKCMEA